MIGAFVRADTVFQNAASFNEVTHNLIGYDHVDEFISETSNWFQVSTQDSEADYSRIKYTIWKIRSSILLGMLPFDHPALRLTELLAILEKEITSFTRLKPAYDKLSRIINFLQANPRNGKRETVFDLLKKPYLQNDAKPTGLVIPDNNYWVSPCIGLFLAETRQILPGIVPIRSRKNLLSSIYSSVVLPWGGKGCSFLRELYQTFRAKELQVIKYPREWKPVPEKLTLPAPIPAGSPKIMLSVENTVNAIGTDPEQEVDPWINREFWKMMKGSWVKGHDHVGEKGDREFLVNARLVLFANNMKVFLQDDRKVIEISEMIDRRGVNAGSLTVLPKTAVSKLGIGDLIVWRTSGSGDYLEELSDEIMKKRGDGDLLKKALDWKIALKSALEKYGSEEICRRLSARGMSLKSHHRYIWFWAMNEIIGPRSESFFYELLAILEELGFLVQKDDVVTTAGNRWMLMKKIIHYHRNAGQQIRKMLLKKLAEVVEQGIAIGDVYHLTLPEVGAGQLSILRVIAIDPEQTLVPYNQIGLVMDLED